MAGPTRTLSLLLSPFYGREKNTLDIIQLLLNNRLMKTKHAATLFEALSAEARLDIFRLLVKYAPDGLVAGEISKHLNIPSTNLSFHLKAIVHSGLASMEREGRNTRYRANIPLMLETIAYLTAECCTGNPDQCRAWRAESGVAPEFLPACCEDKKRHRG
jgi:Predicted transcriptional regulators